MRFNSFRIGANSSAVAGDSLRIVGSTERLESLNAALGSYGVVRDRILEIPPEHAIPTRLENQFAGWTMVFGDDLVLIGRACGDSPDDLYIYVCTSPSIGDCLVNQVKPCLTSWGSNEIMRTWYYECARLTVLPDRMLANNPPWSTLELMTRIRRINGRREQRNSEAADLEGMRASGMGMPFGEMLGGGLIGLMLGGNPARMGLRRRMDDDSGAESQPPRERGTRVGTDVHVG